MKVAHFTNWAPRESGMYESTKDQVKYEQREGLDSIFCDANRETPLETQVDDGWFKPAPWDDAKDADVFVMHSKIPDKLKPIMREKVSVAILHGPTEHMLLKEWMSGRKDAGFNLHINIAWTYDATVVINQHEYDIMSLYDEKDRVHYIPNSIDLERYVSNAADLETDLGTDIPKTLDTPSYAWEYQNRPAICTFDVGRLEKLPAHIIWSMPRIVSRIPTARLNVFGLALEPISTFRNLFCKSKNRTLENLCENIQLKNNDLRIWMRGADIVFNNNMSGILSRVGMECQAMGIPIISYNGEYTKYKCHIWNLDEIAEQVEKCWIDLTATDSTTRQDQIDYARENYDRGKEVKKYVSLYTELLDKK